MPRFGASPSSTDHQVQIETGAGDAKAGGLDAHAAAAAVQLALHKFDWKTSKADKAKKTPVNVSQLSSDASSSASGSKEASAKELGWETGLVFSQSQNLARELMDTPANLMTPTIFTERAKKEFQGLDNVTLNVHDEGERPVRLVRSLDQLSSMTGCS